MASDTVPAAAPAPHNPPPPPTHAPTAGTDTSAGAGAGQGPRGLAGLLSAVDPVRPAFDLNPALAGPDHLDATAAGSGGGASSADFSHDPTTDTATGKNTTDTAKQGVLRTWALAAAKRYEQAGAARLKALDIKKARATALQVKEQRTTNRSEKIVGGNTGTSTNTQSKADKNNGNRTSSSASKGDHKNHRNHDSKAHNGSAGGGTSGGTGRGSKADGGTGKTTHRSPGPLSAARDRATDRIRNGPRDKADHGKQSSGSKSAGPGSAGGSSGGQGGTGRSGKDGKAPTSSGGSGTGSPSGSGRPGRNSNGSSKQPKPGPKTTTATCGDGSGIDMTKKPKDKPAKDKPAKTPDAKGPDRGTPAGTKPFSLAKPDPKAPANDPAKTSPDTKTVPAAKQDQQNKPPTHTPTPGRRGPVVDTQGAREAGYRDGTRIGRIEAQVGAYRDGIKDGRADIKDAAAREKTRLDKAHQTRKQTPPPPPAAPPAPVIPPKPTKPPAVPPRPEDPPMPVQVNSINGNTINLGDGAARPSMSRGEVRTLRGFQKRLNTKTDRMTRVAEATRTLEQHAHEQARQVTVLRELAAGVKGGERLLGALSRLEEAANIQASKAALIHKRAARAAESCRALKANTDTRYGGIYKAVVDSPETTPAEMSYYREMDHG